MLIIVYIFQVPSSKDLGVIMCWILGGKEWLTDWPNLSSYDQAVCGTASVTLGLVITAKTAQNILYRIQIWITYNLPYMEIKLCYEQPMLRFHILYQFRKYIQILKNVFCYLSIYIYLFESRFTKYFNFVGLLLT